MVVTGRSRSRQRRLEGQVDLDITSSLPSLQELIASYENDSPQRPRRGRITESMPSLQDLLNEQDAQDALANYLMKQKEKYQIRKKSSKCGNKLIRAKPVIHYIRKVNDCVDRFGDNAFYKHSSCNKGVKSKGSCNIVYKTKNGSFKSKKV